MNQVEEFEKVVEEAKNQPVKVVVVTGKPGSGKSKVLSGSRQKMGLY